MSNGKKDPKKDDLSNVKYLGLVSLFTDVSSEMVFGLLPLFLLGPLGASNALLGLVEGVAEMLGYNVRMASGAISDRLQKRKPLVLIGYALSAASKPFFALAAVWTDLFAVRSADRVGKGIRTAPRDALISDSTPEGKVGRAFGLHRSMDQAGAIIGPLIAFALFPFLGFDGVFYMSIVPGALAVIVLVFFVKEKFVPSEIKLSIAGNIRSVLAEKRFIALVYNGRVQYRRVQLCICAGKSLRSRGCRQHGAIDLCGNKWIPYPDRVSGRGFGRQDRKRNSVVDFLLRLSC